MIKLRSAVLFAIFAVILSFSAVAQSADGAIRIFADGNEICTDKAPVIENSRTLAPVRPVAEACGINVGWNSETGNVTLTRGFVTVTVTIGSVEMKVYNSVIDKMSTVTLETAPVIIDSSTFVALRPVLEALGAEVEWDADNRIIKITSEAGSHTSEESTDKTSDTAAQNTAAPVYTGNTVDGIEYSGFLEMTDRKITEGASHGLYGRIKTSAPITLVRCRIAGTDMDYTLFFNKEDNLTSYNVFTYFDKLICFSEAGLGKHTFELYAGVGGAPGKLVFSYDYTVVSRNAVQNTQTSAAESIPTQKNDSGNAQEAADKAVLGYYGFRKMTNDKIAEGAPHGLYGNVVSDYPITSVRCRIAGTDMDYKVEIPLVDKVYEYNVFTYFDQLICFSDAGIGMQRFEIYAGANNGAEQLIFSYTYTVTDKQQLPEKTEYSSGASSNASESSDVCLPLEGTIKVTSPYGFRAYNKWEFHKGVDIISSSLAILSVADGTVVDCATGRNSGIGNYVAIQHEGGWVSLYYHLASYDVKIGDKVKKGQRFATMGNTGGNYGVHLHFMTCDSWYGTIWATQNNHHTPPHEYVPQLLSDVMFYNPCYEKINTDKMILCTFRFPSVLEKGSAFSISSSGAFVASENPLKSINLTITDTDGNVVLTHTEENPEYTVSGLYTYTNITAAFDMMCEFDKLPVGKMKVTVTAVSELGRERLVYEKDFEVVSAGEANEEEKAQAKAELSPEEASKTDAFEADSSDAPEITENLTETETAAETV